MQVSKYVRIIKIDNKYVLCNTLNSCIVEVDDNIIQNNIINENKLNASELDFLTDNGFFSDTINMPYCHEIKENRDHTTITINITEQCNFSCPYCYQNDYESLHTISEEIINMVIIYVNDIIKKGVKKLYIYFFGGEPLLYKDKIYIIKKRLDNIERLSNVKIVYGIGTNGFLLDKAFVSHFDKINIDITLTLPNDHKKMRPLKGGNIDTFQVTFANLKELSRLSNVSLHIAYNVHHENINHFELFLKMISTNNIKARISVYYIDNHSFNKKFNNKLKLEDFLKWKSSKAIRLLIKYNFQVYLTPFILYTFECDAYNPWSVKFFSDGTIGVCNATHYNQRIYWSKESSYKNLADNVQSKLSKYKKTFPKENDACRTCKQIGICRGLL